MFLVNNIVLVGNLMEKPILNENDKYLYITVDPAETDMLISVAVPLGNLSESLITYCEKDNLIGINGHIDMEDHQLIIVADKITFMSSKSE